MLALVVGGGGREHALVKALVDAPSRPQVMASPGNAGIAASAECVPAKSVDAWVSLAKQRAVDLVVVGPEAPLCDGLADRLRAEKIAVLGPDAAAARLEGSKSFAKDVMAEAGVPTAEGRTFTQMDAALAYGRSLGACVVKADGLAGGKGVTVAPRWPEAEAAIRAALSGKYGTIVIEELLEGEELSVIALVDGERIMTLAPSQDHKRALDGDRGPNTGGMGAYSPSPRGTPELMAEVEASCLRPVVDAMAARGTPFSGVLYAGLMLTAKGPKVLEYNVRFGDPETQAILPRLDEDAFELFLATARGELPARPARFLADPAVTIVLASEGYPATPRTGDVIRGLDAVENAFVYHAGTKREGEHFVTAGGRVLGVTAMAPSLREAVDRAYVAVDQIRWPGMQHRRDIAHRALG